MWRIELRGELWFCDEGKLFHYSYYVSSYIYHSVYEFNGIEATSTCLSRYLYWYNYDNQYLITIITNYFIMRTLYKIENDILRDMHRTYYKIIFVQLIHTSFKLPSHGYSTNIVVTLFANVLSSKVYVTISFGKQMLFHITS